MGRRCLIVALIAGILVGAGLGGARWYRARQLERLQTQCRDVADSEEWEQLQTLAEEWLQWDESAVDAWLYLGESRSQTGDYAGAVDALSRIPDDNEKSYPALLIASELQFEALNQPLDAVETIQRLLQKTPRSTTARQRLIYFYAVTLQRQQMIEAIRAAIHTQSEPPEAYVYLIIADHLSFSNGMAEAEKWLRSSPDSEVFQVARVLQLIDRIENAETPAPESLSRSAYAELARLTEQFPENVALRRYHVEAAARDQDMDRMEKLFTVEPDAAAEDSVILRHKAWFLLRSGKVDEAEQAIKRSLQLFPLDWHSWNELSAVNRRLGKLDDAEATAKIALVGKELRKELVQLPNARALNADHLQRIGEYAELVGDMQVVSSVHFRLNVLGQRPPGDSD
ncbi:MAG: tetratricopeptide repeat protein [Planctomycetaceae bacterium]|nr:tetratricopeptide repeat protein [Planctomycetaceae bacterium]